MALVPEIFVHFLYTFIYAHHAAPPERTMVTVVERVP